MSTLRVTDTEGRTVHIGPHDICRYYPEPIHEDTAAAVVHVDAVNKHGSIAVLMCRAGSARWAVVYDRDDRVEVAA